MRDPRSIALDRLSRRQAECLRLVARGLEAKEIGQKLGISDLTVKNHLKSARDLLGVSRSIDAARLLANHEGFVPSALGTGHSSSMATVTVSDALSVDRSENGEQTEEVLRDVRTEFDVEQPSWQLPLPFPTRKKPRNDLNVWTRLTMTIVLFIAFVMAFGFFVQAVRGLSAH